MWLTAPNRIGIAGWQVGDRLWRVDARGGAEGVQFFVGDQCFGLFASGDQPLPMLDEQFVRGDELHYAFPQVEGRDAFGFRLVIRPLQVGGTETTVARGLFELLISVQTSLLDSHPTIDLVLPAVADPRQQSIQSIASALHFASHPELESAVLLGPHDAPFTSVVSGSGELRLRLFGEFLEKGVIRRARPWVMVDRSGESIDQVWAADCWHELAASPLPLT
jgi:hypothetical protein